MDECRRVSMRRYACACVRINCMIIRLKEWLKRCKVEEMLHIFSNHVREIRS